MVHPNAWILSKLAERGISQHELARQLGIDRRSLYNKMNGLNDFYYHEVVMICKILGIDNPLPHFYVKEKSEKH